MRFNTIFYCLKQGFVNIVRNRLFTLASISTMAACIFLFGLFYSIVTNVQYVVKEAQTNLCVTIFFEKDTSDEKMIQIGDVIQKRSEVSRIEFTSALEAWDEFKDIYFEGNEEYARAFSGDNPLQYSASYAIYLKDASLQDSLVNYLSTIEEVRKIQKSDTLAREMTSFGMLIGYVSAAIIVILLCVSVFLISNTVSIGIAVRKEEIGIMKLIGATDALVRAPFVVEGIIIGFIGAIIPLGIIYFSYDKVLEFLMGSFFFFEGSASSATPFLPLEEIARSLIPVGLLLGVGIGYIGSITTTRKHLRV